MKSETSDLLSDHPPRMVARSCCNIGSSADGCLIGCKRLILTWSNALWSTFSSSCAKSWHVVISGRKALLGNRPCTFLYLSCRQRSYCIFSVAAIFVGVSLEQSKWAALACSTVIVYSQSPLVSYPDSKHINVLDLGIPCFCWQCSWCIGHWLSILQQGSP